MFICAVRRDLHLNLTHVSSSNIRSLFKNAFFVSHPLHLACSLLLFLIILLHYKKMGAEEFDYAKDRVWDLPDTPSNDDLLELYKLFFTRRLGTDR